MGGIAKGILNLQWKKKKTKKVVPKRKKSNCLKLEVAMKKLRTVQDPILPLLVVPDDPGQDRLQAHEVDLDRDHPQDHVPKVLLVQNKNFDPHDLHEEMNSFTVQFSISIEDSKSKVLQEKLLQGSKKYTMKKIFHSVMIILV